MRIGILGPAGTFSEMAALKWLSGRDAEIRYYDTIVDVSEGIQNDDVDYGIVPIENSLEGSVGETLDVLASDNAGMQMVGEVLVPIKICLLASSHDFDRIRRVVSHPHALAQCRQFLRARCRGKEIKAVDSTAVAAKLASASGDTAALASETAADVYHLNIVEEDVQDCESVTRFVVLSSNNRARPAATGHDKTSILIYLKDRPGALYDVLGEFARRGINLTKIESRPSKRAIGDYMFHIDCEGHVEDTEIKEALNGVKKQVTMLRILGSYPKAAMD